MNSLTTEKFARICARAFKQFGKEAQLRMLQEECAEVIASVNHHLRGRDPEANELAEEIADVFILLNQVVDGMGLSAKSFEYVKMKIERLEKKLI